MTTETLTLAQVRLLVTDFETSTHPPMSTPWDEQRAAATGAVRVYAHQQNMSITQVLELLK